MNNFQWYAVVSMSGREQRAKNDIQRNVDKANLSQYVKEILIPKEIEVSFDTKGNRKEKAKTIFPGYILINMNAMKAAPAVFATGAIFGPAQGTPDHPVPLTEAEISKFINQDSGKTSTVAVATSGFDEGDTVRITGGPFDNFIGTVERTNHDSKTVKISIEIFGRPTSTEVALSNVVKDG